MGSWLVFGLCLAGCVTPTAIDLRDMPGARKLAVMRMTADLAIAPDGARWIGWTLLTGQQTFAGERGSEDETWVMPGAPEDVAWSPNGSAALALMPGKPDENDTPRLAVWRVAPGSPADTGRLVPESSFALAVAPDATRFAYVTEQGGQPRAALESFESTGVTDLGAADSLAWSPDGRWLAVLTRGSASGSGTLVLRDAQTGELRSLAGDLETTLRQVAWADSGHVVAMPGDIALEEPDFPSSGSFSVRTFAWADGTETKRAFALGPAKAPLLAPGPRIFPFGYGDFTLSPGGGRLAFYRQGGGETTPASYAVELGKGDPVKVAMTARPRLFTEGGKRLIVRHQWVFGPGNDASFWDLPTP